MFLHSLIMDPEEEQRRRIRRARIVRRNRIKREVAMGLPVRIRRAPRPREPVFDANALGEDVESWKDQFLASTSPFRPTFGGNGDHSHAPRSDMMHVSQIQPRQALSGNSTAKTQATHHKEPPPTVSTAAPPAKPVCVSTPSPALTPAPSLPDPKAVMSLRRMSAHVLKRWQEAVDRVLVRRHDEILSKDPNRKWRQERLGLRLFARGEFEKAVLHLSKAVSLGVSTGMCWRRLAQCHWRHWEQSGDWASLWDCRGSYEQALTHVEVACNPFALFEYARALECLGDYSNALGVCATILATFPTFQLRKQVAFRLVLLQRYQLFSIQTNNAIQGESTDSAEDTTVVTIDRHTVLIRCIEYTKELLLDKDISEGDQCIELLYMHARLNELLVVESETNAPGVTAISEASTSVALAAATVDHCFDELLRAAVDRQVLSSKVTPGRKPWRACSETYTAFAQYFQARSEPIPASDALARALELLGDSSPKIEAAAGVLSQDRRPRIDLYVVLGRTYYQSNQMEKAIRSMEAVFDADPFHEEARVSLSEWFPDKWKYRLDLEDASQVQIARVLRGIWGRSIASERRKAAEQRVERQLRLDPYDLSTRRAILRLMRDRYAPLFAAQEISARVIQRQARKFLRFARLRWNEDTRHAKLVSDLLGKYKTRKYRYNRHVRSQLAQRLPHEYEKRFEREEIAARIAQRYFRGYRERKAYLVRRDAHRAMDLRVRLAKQRILRFLRWSVARNRCQQLERVQSMDELLARAQKRVARAKERVARGLQARFRRQHGRRDASDVASLVLDQSRSSDSIHGRVGYTQYAKCIQRAWKRYASDQQGSPQIRARKHSIANVVEAVRPETGSTTARRAIKAGRDNAARKIQGQYRRNTMRRSLGRLKRVPAALSPSVIEVLVTKIDDNHCNGVESRALLSSLDTIEQRRALFECSAVVFRGEKQRLVTSNNAKLEEKSDSGIRPAVVARHLSNAIQFSASLRCLVCVRGDFGSTGIVEVMKAVGLAKSLRVLAFGAVDIDSPRLEASIISSTDSMALGRKSSAPTAMQTLSKAVRTANFLLEELYFEDNEILADFAEGQLLAEIVGDFFFARYGHLHTLAAARTRLSDASAELLAAALSINKVLRHLDLHGNCLGDAAATAFATRGLPFNSTLRYLNLADNKVGSDGASALFRSLERDNHTLETLVLTNNNVQNDAVAALHTAWQANAVVSAVNLHGNLVHLDHLDALTAAEDERRAVSPESAELRLFLARRRFGCGYMASSLSPSSPLRGTKGTKRAGSQRRAMEAVVLSPHRWLQRREEEKELKSPIRSPVVVYKWQRQQQQRSPSPSPSPSSSPSPPPCRLGSELKWSKGARRTKLPALD